MPKIFPKEPKIYPTNVQDMPKICPRYARNMSKICPRYAKDMPNICQKYAKTCPRYDKISKTLITYSLSNMYPRDAKASKNTL